MLELSIVSTRGVVARDSDGRAWRCSWEGLAAGIGRLADADQIGIHRYPGGWVVTLPGTSHVFEGDGLERLVKECGEFVQVLDDTDLARDIADANEVAGLKCLEWAREAERQTRLVDGLLAKLAAWAEEGGQAALARSQQESCLSSVGSRPAS